MARKLAPGAKPLWMNACCEEVGSEADAALFAVCSSFTTVVVVGDDGVIGPAGLKELRCPEVRGGACTGGSLLITVFPLPFDVVGVGGSLRGSPGFCVRAGVDVEAGASDDAVL